jgi:hypothetical protein
VPMRGALWRVPIHDGAASDHAYLIASPGMKATTEIKRNAASRTRLDALPFSVSSRTTSRAERAPFGHAGNPHSTSSHGPSGRESERLRICVRMTTDSGGEIGDQ